MGKKRMTERRHNETKEKLISVIMIIERDNNEGGIQAEEEYI